MKHWKIALVIWAVLSASLALAEDFKTIDGKEYKNAKVSRIEPDGIVLLTKSGISKVYFTELPKEVQERFHYDAQQAAQFTSQTIEQNRLARERKVEEDEKRAVVVSVGRTEFSIRLQDRSASPSAGSFSTISKSGFNPLRSPKAKNVTRTCLAATFPMFLYRTLR